MKLYVYAQTGELVGLLKYAEDAAAMLSAGYSDGVIRDEDNNVLYVAGRDGDPGESYDEVADVVARRIEESKNAGWHRC